VRRGAVEVDEFKGIREFREFKDWTLQFSP
jgi:hypothetical protein